MFIPHQIFLESIPPLAPWGQLVRSMIERITRLKAVDGWVWKVS